MAPVLQDSVFLNQHLIALIITGTLMGMVVFFGMFYYWYVNRTKIYLSASIYFMAIFLRLAATAVMDMKRIMGPGLSVDMDSIRYLHLLGGLLAVYMSIYLFCSYLEDNGVFHKYFGMFLLVFMMLALRGYHPDAELVWYFTLMHLGSYALMKLYDVLCLRDELTVKERYPSFFMVILIALCQLGLNAYNEIFMHYEWLSISLISMLLLIFFLWDYKKIYNHRDGIYLKLVFDSETKCYSKNYILEKYEKTPRGTIIFMDINHFKWVNDTFGHTTGDRLVSGFTTRLSGHLTPKMVLGRFGGDEFILLTESGGAEEALAFTETIFADFGATMEAIGLDRDQRVGISIGIAAFDSKVRDAIHLADKAMYASKQQGNDQVTVAGGDSDA